VSHQKIKQRDTCNY